MFNGHKISKLLEERHLKKKSLIEYMQTYPSGLDAIIKDGNPRTAERREGLSVLTRRSAVHAGETFPSGLRTCVLPRSGQRRPSSPCVRAAPRVEAVAGMAVEVKFGGNASRDQGVRPFPHDSGPAMGSSALTTAKVGGSLRE